MDIDIKTLDSPTPIPTRRLTLYLTEEEASGLLYITNSITGPDDGPRGLTHKIYCALSKDGVGPLSKTAAQSNALCETWEEIKG